MVIQPRMEVIARFVPVMVDRSAGSWFRHLDQLDRIYTICGLQTQTLLMVSLSNSSSHTPAHRLVYDNFTSTVAMFLRLRPLLASYHNHRSHWHPHFFHCIHPYLYMANNPNILLSLQNLGFPPLKGYACLKLPAILHVLPLSCAYCIYSIDTTLEFTRTEVWI